MAFLGRLYYTTVKGNFFAFRKDFVRRIRRVKLMKYYSSGYRLFRKTRFIHYSPNKSWNDPYFKPEETAVTLVSTIPHYIGFFPSSPILPNINFLKWFRNSEYIKDDYLVTEFLSKPRVHLTSGFDTQLPILHEYAKPTTSTLTAEDYLGVLEDEGYPFINLPKRKWFESSESLSSVFIKKSSSSGFYTSKFFGQSSYSSALPSLRCAEFIFNSLKEREFPYQGLWDLFGRSKICKLEYDQEKELSTRCVWVPENVLKILGGLVVQDFTLALSAINKNCLFIGKNFSSNEIAWIYDLDQFSDFKARCDWSHFDSDVSSEELLAALTLIQKCYGDSEHTIRYFTLMYRSLLHKNLVLPPGLVYRFDKGLPSGHPFTSLCGTLVNYMRWVMILQRVYGKGRVASHSDAVFSGDDTLLWLKYNEKLFNIDKIIAEVNSDWRCDSVSQTIYPTTGYDSDLQPHFLKRAQYGPGVIGWSTLSMLKTFSYPKKSEFSFISQKTWFYNMVITAPGNTYLNHILLEYLEHATYQEYSTDLRRFRLEIDILRKRFRECVFDGLRHQNRVSLINFIFPSHSYNLESSINIQGKIMVIDACRDWKTVSSVSGKLTDLALLTLIAGEEFVKRHARQNSPYPFLVNGRLSWSPYDTENISRLIGMRHEGAVMAAIGDIFKQDLVDLFPGVQYASNFTHFIKFKLRKLFETHKDFEADLRYFTRVVVRKQGSKIRGTMRKGDPP